MTSFEHIHVTFDLEQHPKPQSPVSGQPLQKQKGAPKCFYHKSSEIAFFCKNPRCTLPMCEKCLSAHRMQHLSKRQIPMQNVVTFNECKKLILSHLQVSKTQVKSNQKRFQASLQKYRQQLIEIIDCTLNRLKRELLTKDEQNSILKLQQIDQTIGMIEKESSLSHIIKAYENMYSQTNNESTQNEQSTENHGQSSARMNSIIDHIKFVADQKCLSQVVERGFTNCKFVKEDKPEITTQRNQTKPNRSLYLLPESIIPKNQSPERTPINKLDGLEITPEQNVQQPEKQNENSLEVKEFGEESQKIIEIKRQSRKSIFKANEPNPLSQKSLSFTNLIQPVVNIKRKLYNQPQFSDVKKYKFADESDHNQNLESELNQNIYTQKLNFDQMNRKQPSYSMNRSSSAASSSNQKHRNKGINLIKRKELDTDHYRRKEKESIFNMKRKIQMNTETDEISFSRDNSADWKRVVNLSESSSSFRNSRVNQEGSHSRLRTENNITANHIPNIQSHQVVYPQQAKKAFFGKELQGDVLNPMEMRMLLLKKKNERKTAEAFNEVFSHNTPLNLIKIN